MVHNLFEISGNISRLLYQDASGYLGQRNTVSDDPTHQPLTMIIDEAARVVYPEIITTLSQARSVNARMIFAYQDQAGLERLTALLGGEPGEGVVDAVLSDMAAPATGHRATDHLRIVALAEAALDFAEAVLAPGGCFVAKVLQGGSEPELLKKLRLAFRKVHHVKPAASRADSAELYVVATGFRGRPQAEDAEPEG